MGQINANPCRDCHGQGKVMQNRGMVVNLPAGIDEGQSIRIPNQGEEGMHGGPPGHLFVEVRVLPDPRFERRDFDLFTAVQVPYAVAALGGQVMVNGLEGEILLDIPPGSQYDDVITLSGQGIPRLNGGGRGDLHNVVRLSVPRQISYEQEQLLRQLLELEQPQ